MMTNEHILWLIDFNTGPLHQALDDITEEESMTRAADGTSHIRWLAGHLASVNHQLLTSLGGSYDLPDNFRTAYKTGLDSSDDPAAYPSMADTRQRLFDVRAVLRSHGESVSDDMLASTVREGSPFPTKYHLSLFLCEHDFYHLGQIIMIRRTLGRERPFG